MIILKKICILNLLTWHIVDSAGDIIGTKNKMLEQAQNSLGFFKVQLNGDIQAQNSNIQWKEASGASQ